MSFIGNVHVENNTTGKIINEASSVVEKENIYTISDRFFFLCSFYVLILNSFLFNIT